jgi:hypothetical protein
VVHRKQVTSEPDHLREDPLGANALELISRHLAQSSSLGSVDVKAATAAADAIANIGEVMRLRLVKSVPFVVTLAVVAVMAPSTVQAAVSYFHQTVTVTGYGTARCPAGYKVTGGGAFPLSSDVYASYYSYEYQLTASFPASPTTWQANATEIMGNYSRTSGWTFDKQNYSPRVTAICVG